MNKRQAIAEFNETVGSSYDHDKGAKSFAWQSFIDSLNKDRLITDKQVQTWTAPF